MPPRLRRRARCFDDRDAALWEEDPHEYIRKGYDIIEDMYSPRTGAQNLVAELIRCREKDYLAPFLAFLVQIFSRCSAGTPREGRPYRQLDGALLAIGSLCERLTRVEAYRAQLEHMLMVYVLPEFTNPLGHLRAKACWVAGMYANIAFADRANFTRLMRAVVERLRDGDLPVRVDAIVALRAFVEASDDLADIRPILPALLEESLRVMSQVDNEDLVYTIETLVEKFGEEIAPYAENLTRNLVAAFWKCVDEGEGGEGGGGGGEGEDDGGGGDDGEGELRGALASLGCLRAISTILDSVSGVPELYPRLEVLLLPVMQRMISTDGQDVFEEVLEIAAYLTYYSPSISDAMWGLWPLMMAALADWAIDYFDHILVPLDNYISRGTERFLAPGQPYLADVMALVNKVLGDADVEDGNCKCAAQLMEAVVLNCRGRVNEWAEPYMRAAGARLQSAEEAQLKDLLLCVFAAWLYSDPVLAVATLSRLGMAVPLLQEWLRMVAAKGKGGHRLHFKREHDKKLAAMGLASLLLVPAAQLPPDLPHSALHDVFRAVLQLLRDLKMQREARARPPPPRGVRRRRAARGRAAAAAGAGASEGGGGGGR